MALERSLRFYQRSLGLAEVKRGDMSQYGRGTSVLLEHPESHQRIVFNWYPKGSPFATPYVPGEGLDHIGVIVPDLEAAIASLLDAGARPTSVTLASTSGSQVCFEDPDGNWIELFRDAAESPPAPSRIRHKPPAKKSTRRPARHVPSRRG
jgi:catechol 2,3-dioxygenase-like lactoylglutathione lyase family enzyme